MATSSNAKTSPFIWIWILSVFLCAILCYEIFKPGIHMHHLYGENEPIDVNVNSLKSINTQLPLDYYSLPYCTPTYGVEHIGRNLGQHLMGDMIQNSPYKFRVMSNESFYLCTSKPLAKHEVQLLKRRISDMYDVNMILDNLPIVRYIRFGSFVFLRIGFPIGFLLHGKDYITNHLKFRVLVHETKKSAYEVVGFEITPCSIERNTEAMSKLKMYEKLSPTFCPRGDDKYQEIKENEMLTFTYEVEFALNNIEWSSRWKAYLEMEGSELHWFSILNSVVSILLIAGFSFRKVRMATKVNDSQLLPSEGISGWNLYMGETHIEPYCSKLLCVMVANGIQIAGTGILTILSSALLFTSQSSRGCLLIRIIVMYLLFGIVSGYVGVILWRKMKGSSEEWSSISWSISCSFNSVAFAIFTIMNIIHYQNRSTATVSLNVYFTLLTLWFCVLVPLTLLGGFLVASSDEPMQFTVNSNRIPRETRGRQLLSWFLVLLAGALLFNFILIELFFVYRSIWLGRPYNNFRFLFVAVIFLLSSCAFVSVGLTYSFLATWGRKWWWKAFFASGSTGFYVFLYSIKYLATDLRGLNGMASAAIYLGYSLIFALAIMLSTGAVGFFSAFVALRHHAFFR